MDLPEKFSLIQKLNLCDIIPQLKINNGLIIVVNIKVVEEIILKDDRGREKGEKEERSFATLSQGFQNHTREEGVVVYPTLNVI